MLHADEGEDGVQHQLLEVRQLLQQPPPPPPPPPPPRLLPAARDHSDLPPRTEQPHEAVHEEQAQQLQVLAEPSRPRPRPRPLPPARPRFAHHVEDSPGAAG